jgi:hypothetical protein
MGTDKRQITVVHVGIADQHTKRPKPCRAGDRILVNTALLYQLINQYRPGFSCPADKFRLQRT